MSGFALLSLLIIFVPITQQFIHHFIEPKAEELQITATAFGGLLLVINAYYSAKRAEAMDKTAIAAAETLEIGRKNAELTKERLITERFSQSVEQLVNENIAVRIGGIYSLERIAKDSRKDCWTILVRNTNLQNAKLFRANLQGANLIDANLQGADLDLANLQEAELWKTMLQGARLKSANLQEAKLQGTNLREVENLEAQQIELADGDSTTALPDNIKAPAHWMPVSEGLIQK